MDKMRVSAHVDLDAVGKNIDELKKHIDKRTKILAVLKANGYGMGAVPIAHYLEKRDDISGYAAATVEEAVELQEAGIRKPILILGYTFADSYEEIIRREIRPVIFTYEMARDYSLAARKLNKKVYCHIAIDTGMSRIGYQVTDDDADEIAATFHEFPELVPEGIFTHFARADERDKSFTDDQYLLFGTMISKLASRGVQFKIRHCANSAAAMEYMKDKLDAVRYGVTMYGMWPSDQMDKSFTVTPVLSLKSHVVYIKTLPAGRSISYGGTYVTESPRVIATVPVGYADGYARTLSGKADVLIRGQRAPIVGRICMDQMMVDVTDIDGVSMLDEVTLIGRDGDECITIEELGDLSGRFNYEFACCLGNRIPRLFYENGVMVEQQTFY